VAYVPRRADLVSHLASRLRSGDLCLTLGAGDLTSLPDDVLAELAARGGP
jgi:UDP-N-acetylmuramate-alanine ligase